MPGLKSALQLARKKMIPDSEHEYVMNPPSKMILHMCMQDQQFMYVAPTETCRP